MKRNTFKHYSTRKAMEQAFEDMTKEQENLCSYIQGKHLIENQKELIEMDYIQIELLINSY